MNVNEKKDKCWSASLALALFHYNYFIIENEIERERIQFC